MKKHKQNDQVSPGVPSNSSIVKGSANAAALDNRLYTGIKLSLIPVPKIVKTLANKNNTMLYIIGKIV